MRQPVAIALCLLLCACAALPEKPAELAAPVIVAKLTLRDLRRADRTIASRDATLGVPVPLKVQPAEAVQLQQALVNRLELKADSAPVAADLNDFDLYSKADGTLTVVINLILRRDGRSSMHRIRSIRPPGAPQSQQDLVQQAIQDLMATVATSGNMADKPQAQPQTP